MYYKEKCSYIVDSKESAHSKVQEQKTSRKK
jgi:hypothetical protein